MEILKSCQQSLSDSSLVPSCCSAIGGFPDRKTNVALKNRRNLVCFLTSWERPKPAECRHGTELTSWLRCLRTSNHRTICPFAAGYRTSSNVRWRTDGFVALRVTSHKSASPLPVNTHFKLALQIDQIRHMSKIKNKSEEQVVAEADVEDHRKDLGPFVVAAETTRMAMLFTDAKEATNPIVFANDSFLSLTGFDRAEILGQSFNSLLAWGTDADVIAQVSAAFKGSPDTDPEVHYRRKDGTECWASVFVCPVRDKNGEVVQHFVSFVDLTKQRRAQTHSNMLINELNHRVKNTLATVQSIVWQALRKSTDAKVIGESIQARLSALSRSHDLLTREKWASAGLRDIVMDALEPFGVSGALAERLIIRGDNIRLSPKVTLALGIAFNELATNAMKYGAFSNEAGSIAISWTVVGNRLTLNWKEQAGRPVSPPVRKGFGLQVIERGLAQELEGSVNLDFQPTGLIFTFDCPASQGARDG
jgi:PAS domain S-box-containing protein